MKKVSSEFITRLLNTRPPKGGTTNCYPKRRSRLRRSASEPCVRVSISHGSSVIGSLPLIPATIDLAAVVAGLGSVFSRLSLSGHPYIAHWRAHSIFSAIHSDHLPITVPTSAYPAAFPQAFAFWGIPPLRGIRLTPTLTDHDLASLPLRPFHSSRLFS